MIEFGYGTHQGLVLHYNKSTYAAHATHGIFLVVDGIGKQTHGVRAAAITRDTITASLARGGTLHTAINAAHQALSSQRKGTQNTLPNGAMIALLKLSGKTFQAFCIGSNRIHLFHHRLYCLNNASHIQALQEQELIDKPDDNTDNTEPANQPDRPSLTHTLGITPMSSLCIRSIAGKLKHGMSFLLSSDGCHEGLNTQIIQTRLAQSHLSAQEIVDLLTLDALERDGKNSVTAIVVRCHNERTA